MNILNIFKKKNNSKIKCPRCHIWLRQITKNNITIDVCNNCEGMWLDKGEIEELIKLSKKKVRKNAQKK